MKRLIFALPLLALLVTFVPLPKATCQEDRCQVAKSYCGGQADLFNLLCVGLGGSPSECYQKYFIQYYRQCLKDNGC